MVIKTHPIYDRYEFDGDTGLFRLIGKKDWLQGALGGKYYRCNLSSNLDKSQHPLTVHRAMWTAFNGPIPDCCEIDHIDSDRLNNKIDNLQCITVQENRKRRNHDFLRTICKNARHNIKKPVKATNLETGETHVFINQSKCARYYGCSAAMVYLICEKKNNAKTFKKLYIFEYTDDEIDTIVPSKRLGQKYAKVKPVKTTEEKKTARILAQKKYKEKKIAKKSPTQLQV